MRKVRIHFSDSDEMQDKNTFGKVVSISLDVVSRETGRKVKTGLAQLKIIPSKEGILYFLAACEEGMFEARFSTSKLKKAKMKLDLQDEEWEKITAYVFNANLIEENQAPLGFENVILSGRLTSLEEYDTKTGELVGEELSSIPPDFEISVRTNGMLSIEYGLISLQYKDMDDLTETERSGMNLLTWILDMAKQLEYVQSELFQKERLLKETQAILVEKERAIDEMESDYKTILHDMEDRFFQVLESKKRKISELEGENHETFSLWNENYKQKQKSNLKILNLEDIVLGEEDKKYGERRVRRARKPRNPRMKTSPAIHDDIKEEIVVKDQESLEIKPEDDVPKLKQSPRLFTETPNLDTENTPDYNMQDVDNNPESGSESELAPDVTDYSDSGGDAGDDEGHVQTHDDASGPNNNEDDENETEYSD